MRVRRQAAGLQLKNGGMSFTSNSRRYINPVSQDKGIERNAWELGKSMKGGGRIQPVTYMNTKATGNTKYHEASRDANQIQSYRSCILAPYCSRPKSC